MSMKRKLARAKARHNLKKQGYVKINKRMTLAHPVTRVPYKLPSFFADHWREFA